MDAESCRVGQHVKKESGDSRFYGVVVAVFPKVSGAVRVVVENADGLLHIYSPSQLEEIVKTVPGDEFGRCAAEYFKTVEKILKEREANKGKV